jgi:hypothetical protein
MDCQQVWSVGLVSYGITLPGLLAVMLGDLEGGSVGGRAGWLAVCIVGGVEISFVANCWQVKCSRGQLVTWLSSKVGRRHPARDVQCLFASLRYGESRSVSTTAAINHNYF